MNELSYLFESSIKCYAKNFSVSLQNFTSLNSFDAIIESIVKNIVDYGSTYALNNVNNDAEMRNKFKSLGFDCYEQGMPLPLVFDLADGIKNNIFKTLLIKDSTCALFENISDFFDIMTNCVARGYLYRSADEFTDFNLYLITTFRITYYYTSLLSFMNKINEAVKLDDVTLLPDLDAVTSDLSILMSQPQMNLFLGDELADSELWTAFENMFKTAGTLAYFLKKNDYRKLYVIYQTLYEKADLFQRKMSEVFSIFSENIEWRFRCFVRKNVEDMLPVVVSIINVNNLKSINRIFSKDAGHRIIDSIQQIIDRLTASAKDNIVYVKTPKDEFRICFVDLSMKKVNDFLKMLKTKIETMSIVHKEAELPFYLSFGTVYFDGINNFEELDYEKLFTYVVDRAKRSKKNESLLEGNNVRAVVDQITSDNLNVLKLQNMFLNKSVTTFFQPIKRLEDGEISSVEALARFTDETGIHSVGGYIDLLVELDAVIELDMLVLEHILENAEKIKSIADTVFINVSALSLASDEFIDLMKLFISEMSVKNLNPVFEITEQTILTNVDLIENLYAQFKVFFALDDFGTGFSSLRMVVKLAERGLLKYLKIDGSLIKDLGKSEKARMVVDSIRYMADNLSIETIAEFVEDEGLLDKSKELGINYAQGYFISKPVTLDELISRKFI